MTSILPVVLLCVLLLLTGRWMNRRLYFSFGWRGVLALAWLGTPVHEFSHLVACWIGRNRVEGFALFMPNSQTGSLGFVKHSYRKDSFYQRVIGNTLISIAPFFGGATAIYLLTGWLFPDILQTFSDLPFPGLDDIDSRREFLTTVLHFWKNLVAFYLHLFSSGNMSSWPFWAYLFAIISLAAHLSPSRSDFVGFWGPVVILLAFIFIGHVVSLLAHHYGLKIDLDVSSTTSLLLPLLGLAWLFLMIGALATFLVTLVWDLLIGPHDDGM